MNIEELAHQQAEFFHVFSNATRVLILWALQDRELPVGSIAEIVDSSPQNVSQHLKLMKAFGLVSSRRHGQNIYYQINPEGLTDHCQSLGVPRLLQWDVRDREVFLAAN